jgi:hypothetical protein
MGLQIIARGGSSTLVVWTTTKAPKAGQSHRRWASESSSCPSRNLFCLCELSVILKRWPHRPKPARDGAIASCQRTLSPQKHSRKALHSVNKSCDPATHFCGAIAKSHARIEVRRRSLGEFPASLLNRAVGSLARTPAHPPWRGKNLAKMQPRPFCRARLEPR